MFMVGCADRPSVDVARAVASEVPGSRVQVTHSTGEHRVIVSLNGEFQGDSAALASTADRVARRVRRELAADSIVDVGVLFWVKAGTVPTPLAYRYTDPSYPRD